MTGTASILVVDDERGMRQTLRDILEDEGYNVAACGTAAEALQLIHDLSPDIVVSDLNLPDGSGLEIIPALNRTNAEAAFIVITGNASLETAMEALNEGVFAYHVKPLDMDALQGSIRHALTQQLLTKENKDLLIRLEQANEQLRLARDTERRRGEEALAGQAQELARSNKELEQFAYVASHDLQEPLRMVTSYTQLLARRYQGQLDSDADEFIDYAVDGANRMQGLINALLDYSRVGSRGKAFESVDCEVIFREVKSNLKVAIEEIGAVVTHDPLPVVVADSSQLSRLFQNIIGNALKYRSEGPPQVHVSALRNDGYWSFSVRDNGIGIDSQYADRIFTIFQRLHTREKYSGTGIGLAVCKKIVERHGGQ